MNDPDGGILIIDKQAGMTSAGVVSRIRRLLNMKRVGHTGTLDPFATGVLPICFGRATRASAYMLHWDKRYRVGIRLGYATTTMDIEGEAILPIADVGECRKWLEDESRIRQEVERLVEEKEQRPPRPIVRGGRLLKNPSIRLRPPRTLRPRSRALRSGYG